MTNFASVLFNTQVKALSNYFHISTFSNGIFSILMHHNKALIFVSGEVDMIKVALIQSADIFCTILGTLKGWGSKFNDKH